MQERMQEGGREALPAAPATPEGQGGAAPAGGAAPRRTCSRLLPEANHRARGRRTRHNGPLAEGAWPPVPSAQPESLGPWKDVYC